MADPFSVSAGVVGVISLGLTLSQGFLRYYAPWRDYDDEIRGFTTKVNGLLQTLRLFESLLRPGHELQLPSDQYRLLVLDNLASCKEACERLEKMLEECKSSNLAVLTPASTRKSGWIRLKRAAYPFKKETLVTLSELVSGLRDNLSLALQLLTIAFMGQQNGRVEDLVTRTTSIDLRTTKILTTVEQQQISLTSQALIKSPPNTSGTTQISLRTMPEPSLLRELCDQQQLMNSWLRRKRRVPASQIEQISQYCTCRRKPRFLSPRYGYYTPRSFLGLEFAAYSLHEESCLLYVSGQHAMGVAGSYKFCNKFLGLSLQFMMSLTRGAGSFAISPVIQIQAVVAHNSPAFKLIADARYTHLYKTGLISRIDNVKTTLLRLFHEGRATPTDRLEDGSTILHALCHSIFLSVLKLDPDSRGDLTEFVRALINAGVPFNERTVDGSTPADTLIRGFRSYGLQSESPQFDEWLRILDVLLNSGGYINSPMAGGCFEDWSYLSSQAARSLVTTNPQAFEFLEIEMAILFRSVESLQGCLMSQSYRCHDNTGYFRLLFLSLGWPDGLGILLDSPLGHVAGQIQGSHRYENPIGLCFVEACGEGEIECALILMKHLQWFDLWQLRAAVKQKEESLITGIISGLVKSRQQLQQLAVEHLPHHVLRSLSLPTSGLLDTKASEVYRTLVEHNIDAQEPSYLPHSVYSYAEDDITIFERLYAAGFTDLNQCDGDSMTSLLNLYCDDHPRDSINLIKSAEWLVSRGARLYHLSEEGYPSIFSLANAFGVALSTWHPPSYQAAKDLRSLMLRKHPDVNKFLCVVIREDCQDNCLCACANDGCSSFQQILRGFFQIAAINKPDSYTTALAAMIDGLEDAVPEWLSGAKRRDIAVQTLQYITFDALELTHTCHLDEIFLRFRGIEFEQMDDDEVQEIREDQATLISQLDQLMDEFSRKYDELGLGLHDFIQKYWRPRMYRVLYPEDYLEEDPEQDPEEVPGEVPGEKPDSEYQERVRELGIILT
ncbi:hypothetical protein BJX70DRAFT_66428 [Aspergillus crustosus]